MKQTAVRWLFDQLWEQPKDKLTWYAILKQAEEKERKLYTKKEVLELLYTCPYEFPENIKDWFKQFKNK